MQRRLEYFEDQLDETPRGREVLALIQRHAREVMTLINHNRSVMVAWNRHNGPAFIRSFMDSGFEDNTPFARKIDTVTLRQLLLAMTEALMDAGSPELKNDIALHAPFVLRTLDRAGSLKEIIAMIGNHKIEAS